MSEIIPDEVAPCSEGRKLIPSAVRESAINRSILFHWKLELLGFKLSQSAQ